MTSPACTPLCLFYEYAITTTRINKKYITAFARGCQSLRAGKFYKIFPKFIHFYLFLLEFIHFYRFPDI